MQTFLVDENLPKTIRLQGDCKILHVADLKRQMSDSEIWQYAKENNCIIITKDTDFYQRVVLYGAPPKIIWIRLGNMRRKQLEQKIYNMWNNIVKKIEKYDLLEIHDDKIEGL